MSKKLIITLSIIFSVVAVVLILFWTLFALSSVTVQFHSTTMNLTEISQQEIVSAGNFHYGACVLFEGKNKYIQNIQNAAQKNEKLAYLKVLNIETVFPNKMVIHVAEREEVFAIKSNEHTYICDNELRVLQIDVDKPNLIEVQGLEINNADIKIGDFLSVKQGAIKRFYSVMLENNRNTAEQLGKFAKIDISSYTESLTQKEYYSLTLTTRQGQTYIINNPDFAFSKKVQLLFSMESTLYSKTSDGNILDAGGKAIYVKEIENEYYFVQQSTEGSQVLTQEILLACRLKVDNLPLDKHINRTENDVFASLVKV